MDDWHCNLEGDNGRDDDADDGEAEEGTCDGGTDAGDGLEQRHDETEPRFWQKQPPRQQ